LKADIQSHQTTAERSENDQKAGVKMFRFLAFLGTIVNDFAEVAAVALPFL